MLRLVGSILVLGLLSGCASFLQMGDDIALSGQGVLASYDQSMGDLTDAKRVGISREQAASQTRRTCDQSMDGQ